MKLATRKDDSRDGQLVVVSRDLKHAVMASRITGTLQRALDDWAFMAPQLQDLYDELNHGRAPNSFPFDPDEYLSPLPRAFQRIEAGAYPAYEKRLQKARLVADAPLPEDMVPLKIAPSHALLSPRGPVSMSYPDLRTDSGGRPVSTQETDPDDFADEREAEEADEHAKAAAPGTHRTVPVQDAAARETAARKAAARGGLDFSAQLVAICNDLPLNLTEDEAERHLLLLGLANAWRLHVTGDPAGRGRDRGLALAPVLVTPDELGEEPVARADGLVGGKAHDDDVDAGEAVADHLVEPLPQEGAGAVQPGGVDDDDLTVLAVDDGADDAPGRLRAGRGDGHLPADHRIGEGRLAGVGPPDDAGESGPESLGGRESRLGGPGGGGAVIHRLLLLRARVWPQS